MARTKFTFEKRQREIARQQKQKEKAARRAEAKQSKDQTEPVAQSGDPDAGDMGDALPSSEENPSWGCDSSIKIPQIFPHCPPAGLSPAYDYSSGPVRVPIFFLASFSFSFILTKFSDNVK